MDHHRDYKKSAQPLAVRDLTKNISLTIYILQIACIFTGGLFSIVPLLLCYVFRRQAQQPWLDTHFCWQIQTFWLSSLFFIAGTVFGLIPFLGWLIGVPCFLIGSGLVIFRSVKGWRRLARQEPLQNLLR